MMNYQELLQSPIIPPQIVPLIQKAAHHIAPVLIQGELGTGKDQIAKIIHYAGNLKEQRFYKIDCRILAEDTFHIQVFHLLKDVNYGAIPCTLYLKEVGSLRHGSQLKLLEMIEDGLFTTDDEKKILKSIRFISSSSDNLKDKVAQGTFSGDLYYQLNTFSIIVPPLRDRAKEISTIVNFILEAESKKMNIKRIDISNDILKRLESYWWPGNVRELEHVLKRGVIFSSGGTLSAKDLCLDTEDENSSFFSFLKKVERETSPSREKSLYDGQENNSITTFFIELVHRIKNPLVSIKTFTQLLRDRFNDEEFKDHFYRVVTDDIEKIDSVLNALLNYIKIDTPIEKTNTVHLVLEDVLRKHAPQIKNKQIKILKQYGQDLPEAMVHEEQLRYILSTLLQYGISLVPPEGNIGFLTKSLKAHKERDNIQILIVFTGYKKPAEPSEKVLGIPAAQQEETIELELRLIRKIVQKNQGAMQFEVNKNKSRTLISLNFPVERRKVIHYPSKESL